jgi:drug/metabolite transporter (DMT)-like permease
MIFLLGSILFSTFLTVAFKLCDRFGINKFQAIIFNYLVCLVTGSIVNNSLPSYTHNIGEPWFKWALVMGLGFVVSFNLIAITVERSGLAIASVASKLSLVIPFVVAIFLYSESVSIINIAGIILAVIAVIFTLYSPVNKPAGRTGSFSGIGTFVLPLVVFLLTGFLDSLVKYVEQNYLNGDNNNEYLVMAFTSAFLGGFMVFLYRLARGQASFELKAMLAGILIGIPNYFSIWCLVKVLKLFPGQSAEMLPVTNLGIVLTSALIAAFVFKEHLRRINWIGIILSIISICLIAFG